MKYTFKIAEIATEPEEAVELVNQINNICNSSVKLRNIIFESNPLTIEETGYEIGKWLSEKHPTHSIIIEPIL